MTSKEEYNSTENRVLYGCTEDGRIPNEALRSAFLSLLAEKECSPFVKIIINVKGLIEFLYANPVYNRIHSISLDVLECVPLRPDIAFDRYWSAFEILLHQYYNKVWRDKNAVNPTTVSLFKRFCTEVVFPILNKSDALNSAYSTFIKSMPESITRYAVARMLIERELKVNSQYFNNSQRAESILGEHLFKLFKNEYITENNGAATLDAANHYRAQRKLYKVLTESTITFKDQVIPNIGEDNSLDFILSCILYASRCERFHGDHFSPFYSYFSSFYTYGHWYWILNMTHFLFWILMMKTISVYHVENPIDESMICTNINSVLENNTAIFGWTTKR